MEAGASSQGAMPTEGVTAITAPGQAATAAPQPTSCATAVAAPAEGIMVVTMPVEGATATQTDSVTDHEVRANIERALNEKRTELAALHKCHTRAGGGKGSGRWNASDHQKKEDLEKEISQLQAQAAALPVIVLPVTAVEVVAPSLSQGPA